MVLHWKWFQCRERRTPDVWSGAGGADVVAPGTDPIKGPEFGLAKSGSLTATRVPPGRGDGTNGADRLLSTEAEAGRASSFPGKYSKNSYLLLGQSERRCHGPLTFNAVEHLSATILLLARPSRASFPSFTFARISWDVCLSGFSRTKKTNDIIAKNALYIEFQYSPKRRFLCFISMVMWMILRDTLMPAAAQAYDRLSIFSPAKHVSET